MQAPSTFDVERSMFKLLHLKIRLNLHITLKLRIQVRSSEFKDCLCNYWCESAWLFRSWRDQKETPKVGAQNPQPRSM